MSKKIVLKTLEAGTIQAITIATVTNPATSIAAVCTIAVCSGLMEQLLARRAKDISDISAELTHPETAKMIKKMSEEQFLDDLSYSMEKVLIQRTSSKRILMRNVFLGYLRTNHKTAYPLEKMYKVVENLTLADVVFFQKIFQATEFKQDYPVPLPWISKKIMDDHHVPPEAQQKMLILHYTDDPQEQQSRANLVNEGLLREQNEGVGMYDGGGGDPQIYITPFGEYFKGYLLEVNDL